MSRLWIRLIRHHRIMRQETVDCPWGGQNDALREACPDIPYIDLCEYLDASGYKTLDGVHYDQATCQKIYDYYKQTTPLY